MNNVQGVSFKRCQDCANYYPRDWKYFKPHWTRKKSGKPTTKGLENCCIYCSTPDKILIRRLRKLLGTWTPYK